MQETVNCLLVTARLTYGDI